MNSLPPTRRAGRPPGPISGAPAAGVLTVAVALLVAVLAGCATSPPTPALTATPGSPEPSAPSPQPTAVPSSSGSRASNAAGLVIAAVEGTPSLGLVGGDGRVAPLTAPARPVRQLRSGATGLVAVLDDGTIGVARPNGSAMAWSIAPGIRGIAAVAVEPSGRRLALLGLDRLGQGNGLTLGITNGLEGPARSVASQGLEANGGPAWLADGRIALRALAPGENDVIAFVDPATGSATTLALDAIDIFASADGATVAIPSVATIRVGPSADVAAAMHGAAVETPAGGASEQLADVALDATGSRIGYVWADADGIPRSIRICTAAAGWRETSRFDIPSGATRVLLAWAR
jgi:hypothetical protein